MGECTRLRDRQLPPLREPLDPATSHGYRTLVIDYVREMWHLALDGELQGIWFWGALYALVLCSYSVVMQWRTRSWPSTEGELIKASIESFGAEEPVPSERDYTADALYRYTVSGQSFEGKRVSPWVFVASRNLTSLIEKQLSGIEHLPGGKVAVYYHPRRPHKSYLAVAGKLGIGITVLVAAAPMLLYVSRFHL